ncbi:MAG: sorbosone dehydrogenase family protein [Mesorhizobium sp.]|nr:sorbosone dehydrogenase family protein [Mesorhizobium sp.]MBN9241722.1 sorbosone dehydrogenase family protein [Mesorhizobium sp.]MBN9272748.1 sorbosone dehydrogenase family protein [Mesorhizobium sp.]
MRLILFAALSAILAVSAAAAEEAPVLKGAQAFGGWQADRPGVWRLIRPDDMPKPNTAGSASNGADEAAAPKGVKPHVPQGFSVERIASGISNPRVVRVAPNGDLFVADSRAGQVRVYRLGKDGKVVEKGIFAKGLARPYGIAFYPAGNPQWVYVADTGSVVRFAYHDGDMQASGKPQAVIEGLPTGGHWTRDIAFSPDGATLYVSIGSGSNVAEGMGKEPAGWTGRQPRGAAWGEEKGRAEVRAYDPDGRNGRTVATGLRNCSGMTVQPATGALWCVVNERDGLGDNVPFDYATTVKDGAFYGWPWFYIGDHQDPRHPGARPDLAGMATVPDVLIQAHSAPLGIAFYDGGQFPAEYKGDAFVALHGSWNRGTRTGYKVVRLKFENGRPTGAYQDFMTGFVTSDAEVWGRPVGVAVAKDGALIVTEDGSGTIWRVAYDGAKP